MFRALHFPTWILVIGYVSFWIELYVIRIKKGSTSLLAPLIAFTAGLFLLWLDRGGLKAGLAYFFEEWKRPFSFRKIYGVVVLLGMLAVITITLQASFLPPHLLPELDALKYHYALPRQHLIRHNFAHLSWSSGDLFLLPVQCALAPYWFATHLPNKIPQFFFMICLWSLCARLTARLALDQKTKGMVAMLTIVALAGSHGLSIQYGTAMLDIATTYLFIAALDSFMGSRPWHAAVEFAFYLWSKPFIPFQMLLTCCLMAILIRLVHQYKWNISWGFDPVLRFSSPILKKTFNLLLLISLPIALPFTLKSLYHAGTPLYPFGVGHLAPLSTEMKNRQSDIERTALGHLNIRDSYGRGRSWKNFFGHFWRVAVPTQGVNNEFDYPLGLPYLIFFIPFLIFLLQTLIKKRLALLPWLCVVLWASWWMGSQQARWLYVPLCLMIMCTLSVDSVASSIGVKIALLLSLSLTGISLARAHRSDCGRSGWDVLRSQDKALMRIGEANEGRPGPTPVVTREVTYAQFEVSVISEADEWIFKQ